jgi:hypothetical protein
MHRKRLMMRARTQDREAAKFVSARRSFGLAQDTLHQVAAATAPQIFAVIVFQRGMFYTGAFMPRRNNSWADHLVLATWWVSAALALLAYTILPDRTGLCPENRLRNCSH